MTTKQALVKLAKDLEALEKYKKYHAFDFYFTDTGKYSRQFYPDAVNFLAKGAHHRFRAFIGANRSGKSLTGAYELICHATGLYPSWWTGRLMKKPHTMWIVVESGALWRDSLQHILMGLPGEEPGTGLLPKDLIVGHSALAGTPGGYDRIQVKHTTGNVVTISIKTYEMGREKFQAAKVDLALFDEEPPEEIYTEVLMRLMGTGKDPGISMMLFTPLKGLSKVVLKYLPKGKFPENGVDPEIPERFVCRVKWKNIPHLTELDKQAMLLEMPANQRGPRTEGLPALGSGCIYPVEEDFIVVKPFAIPDYWPRAYGLDFGWNNTAVVWVTQDPITKVYYVYAEYKRGHQAPYVHANAIKAKGAWIPGLADPSGGNHSRQDGSLEINEYISLGLKLSPGDNGILSGISKILNLFESGGLKIVSHCNELLDELRIYRYDTYNPNVPAKNQDDHLCDALRYVLSMFDYYAVKEPDMFDSRYEKTTSFKSRDPLSGY